MGKVKQKQDLCVVLVCCVSPPPPTSYSEIFVHFSFFLCFSTTTTTTTTKGSYDLSRLISSQPGSEKWREYKINLLHKGRAAGDIYLDLKYVTKETEAEVKARMGEAKVQLEEEMVQAGTTNVADLITTTTTTAATATTTTSQFIPPGVLGVMVKRGDNLYNVGGMFTTQDPYVAIIPSWLPKQQSHKTGTIDNGGKNCTWNKKDAPFGHFPVEEGSSTNDSDYSIRIEVVDDNTLNDTLIGSASINVLRWMSPVGEALLLQRGISKKQGLDVGDVLIPGTVLEDVTVQLTHPNGKPAGELLVGIRFAHAPGAPPGDTDNYTNEASTGDVNGVSKTCGTLKVTVMKAMNLKDADWGGGESDPFVQLHLEPRASKEASQCFALESAETRIKNGAGRRADFNETFHLPVYRSTTGNSNQESGSPSGGKGATDRLRLNNRRLRLTVKDKDPRFLGLGSDDVLGTAVQDLSMVLRVGTITSEIALESKAGGTVLNSKLKIKTEFLPADPVVNISSMHAKTGKLQIYIQEAKHLKDVENFLGGDQDPYCAFRLVHKDDDLCLQSTPKWTTSRYINGGGQNVVFADWIELDWTQEMVDDLKKLQDNSGVSSSSAGAGADADAGADAAASQSSALDNVASVLEQSNFQLQIALWDENFPRTDNLIGAGTVERCLILLILFDFV